MVDQRKANTHLLLFQLIANDWSSGGLTNNISQSNVQSSLSKGNIHDQSKLREESKVFAYFGWTVCLVGA